MTDTRLRLYDALSRLPGPSSYSGKLFLVAFLGTHIPLLGAIAYTALSQLSFVDALPLLGATLVATAVGAGLTLWALHALLAPIRVTTDALNDYVEHDTVPTLPTEYTDRAGQLMRNTQQTVTHLDALLQFQTRMLGVVSHDARGPATSILMAANTIEQQMRSSNPDVELVQSLADRVETAVHYQLDMTDSLLEVARFGEGELSLDTDREPVESLVTRLRDNFAAHADRRDHILTVTADVPEGLTLVTDVQKLEQVLSNLLSNAIKYTPKGGHVTLRAESQDDRLLFHVQDDGKGIPDSLQDELFDAYRRADRDDADPTGSMGLGLWICKTFTDALGGEIAVDSAPNEGTTFTVQFPLAAVTDASTAAA